MRAVSLLVGLALSVAVGHAQEKKVVELNSIRLYLPDDKLRQRIGEADPLVTYIKAIQKEAETFWAKADQPKAKGLLIVVGVKPDKKAKVWCEAVDGEIPADTLTKLEKQLSEIAPVTVKDGPIAFAVEVKLSGQKPEKFPEMPKAWAEAAKKSKEPLLVPDGLFKVIWPD
jgi:hypothetical protein